MREIVERFLVGLFGAEVPAWAKILASLTNVFLILAASWLLLGFVRKVLRTLNQRMAARSSDPEDQKRIDTLMRVFRYIASVVIGAVTVMLVLSEFGISIAPILATAGVAGLAIGFGAQSLVKDYFTGFVMILENQIHVGDVVEVGGKSGKVEDVTLRYVRMRDPEGAVHYVPNGVISTVTNRSREFAYAMIEVGVAYKENLDHVFELIKSVGTEIQRDPVFGEKILEPVEILGVQDWADSAVMLRFRLKTRALEQWAVRREVLRRLKMAFDRQGVEIPFPCRNVYARNDS
jgi:moderate conductance mechanosensitive channel